MTDGTPSPSFEDAVYGYQVLLRDLIATGVTGKEVDSVADAVWKLAKRGQELEQIRESQAGASGAGQTLPGVLPGEQTFPGQE